MAFYGDIFQANFYDLKFKKSPKQRRFRASERFWNQFLLVKSPSDIFKPILEND